MRINSKWLKHYYYYYKYYNDKTRTLQARRHTVKEWHKISIFNINKRVHECCLFQMHVQLTI